MTEADAIAFARRWAALWNAVDIDGVVAHLEPEAEMTSPLAARLTGAPTVRGRDRIGAYWRQAYGDVVAPDLQLEATVWDGHRRRLVVWWRARPRGELVRACEFMDFDAKGRIHRSEAYYGAAA